MFAAQSALTSSSSVSQLLDVLPVPVRRLGLFLDVQNVLHAEREVGARVDWSALLADLQQVGVLSCSMAFLANHVGNIRRAGFLESLGFTLVTKNLKRSGHRLRADLDVDLAIGVVRHARELDVSFVVCGDNDLSPAWEYAQELKSALVVLGFPHSTAHALRSKFPFVAVDPWLVSFRRRSYSSSPRVGRREAA